MSSEVSVNQICSSPNKWLTWNQEQLLSSCSFSEKDLRLLQKFCQMGLPVLKTIKSGYVAEMGDIEFCLLIHVGSVKSTNDSYNPSHASCSLEALHNNQSPSPSPSPSSEDQTLIVQVCHIDNEGQLVVRLESSGQPAQQLLNLFLIEFPDAVWTSSQRKPLCFFLDQSDKKTVPSPAKSSKSAKSAKSSKSSPSTVMDQGSLKGYVSYRLFQKIMTETATAKNQQGSKLVVFVPQ